MRRIQAASPQTRRPTWRGKKLLGVLAVAVLPFMVIHLITRTPLFGSVLAWLGRDVFLGVAIMMLVIFVLVAFVALIYGYRLENPPRRRPRRD